MNDEQERSPERAGEVSSPSPQNKIGGGKSSSSAIIISSDAEPVSRITTTTTTTTTKSKKSAAEILQSFIQLLHHNPNSPNTRFLDLSNSDLNFEFSSLFSIIKLPPQILRISFENCTISERCVNHIVQGLNRNPHIPEIVVKDLTLLSLG